MLLPTPAHPALCVATRRAAPPCRSLTRLQPSRPPPSPVRWHSSRNRPAHRQSRRAQRRSCPARPRNCQMLPAPWQSSWSWRSLPVRWPHPQSSWSSGLASLAAPSLGHQSSSSPVRWWWSLPSPQCPRASPAAQSLSRSWGGSTGQPACPRTASTMFSPMTRRRRWARPRTPCSRGRGSGKGAAAGPAAACSGSWQAAAGRRERHAAAATARGF